MFFAAHVDLFAIDVIIAAVSGTIGGFVLATLNPYIFYAITSLFGMKMYLNNLKVIEVRYQCSVLYETVAEFYTEQARIQM